MNLNQSSFEWKYHFLNDENDKLEDGYPSKVFAFKECFRIY